jgi:hypothetical protein
VLLPCNMGVNKLFVVYKLWGAVIWLAIGVHACWCESSKDVMICFEATIDWTEGRC